MLGSGFFRHHARNEAQSQDPESPLITMDFAAAPEGLCGIKVDFDRELLILLLIALQAGGFIICFEQ